MEDIEIESLRLSLITIFSNTSTTTSALIGDGVIIFFCLIFYALFSSIEVSFFSTSLFQTQQLKEHKERASRLFSTMMEKPVQFLWAILLAKSLFLFGLIWTLICSNILKINVIWIILMVLSGCLLLDFFIKRYAKIAFFNAIRWTAYPVYALFILFYPITMLLSLIFGTKMENKQKNVSLDEISDAIENVDMEKFIDLSDQEDARLLKGVVRFGETEAKEIMRLRNDMIAIEKSQSLETVFKTMLESGYTRFPVYEEDLDHILGIVVLKDFLPYLLENKSIEWQTLMRPAFFVSENKMIDELLQEFQKKSVHLAVVVDEYGGTSGIVTLEDVLEEIVGEIGDEYDSDEDKHYCQVDPNTWEFEAKTHLSDFCKILNINDDYFDAVRGDADSLGGLVLELIGTLPQLNEEVSYRKFTFKVIDLDHRRVLRLLITISENMDDQNEE